MGPLSCRIGPPLKRGQKKRLDWWAITYIASRHIYMGELIFFCSYALFLADVEVCSPEIAELIQHIVMLGGCSVVLQFALH